MGESLGAKGQQPQLPRPAAPANYRSLSKPNENQMSWQLANFLRVADWPMFKSHSQSARWAGPQCGLEVQVGDRQAVRAAEKW